MKHSFPAASVVLLWVATLGFSVGCQPKTHQLSFTVSNPIEVDRKAETVSIPAEKFKDLLSSFGPENLLLREKGTDSLLVTQAIDLNGDGTIDELLFQTDINANGQKDFTLSAQIDGATLQPKSQHTTFSRFVPERIDDYAWENDRVAFRTYGPVAQQLAEENKPGGTLTSGIDAWFKRVPYPIINDWYKKNLEQPGYYHKDHGEGYDPYHVGASRGIGGIGILQNDSLHVSKNFIRYKTIAEGPIRTVFELTYAPWQVNGQTVQETKRISLDLGSHLSKFESIFESLEPIQNLAIGITLHDKQGEVKAQPAAGWFRYWEPMDGSFLGTGIVLKPEMVQGVKDHRVNTKDQSHLFVLAQPTKYLQYYAGFGWEKSGHFKTPEAWDAYLAVFAKRMAAPLEVRFK